MGYGRGFDDLWYLGCLMTSGISVKFVAIANPTTRNCEFYNCFKDPRWHKVKISCFDSPNMIANGFVDKESVQDELDRLSMLGDEARLNEFDAYKMPVGYLLTAKWVMGSLMRWGMDHPLSLSKVFGEFPVEDDTVLIQLQYIEDATNRTSDYTEFDTRCIGVDVARFGEDKTIFTELIGAAHIDTRVMVKRDTMDITGRLVRMINEDTFRKTIVTIDATGLGSGVVDALREAQTAKAIGKNVQIVEVHFGAGPANPDETDAELIKQDKARYVNLKSKMFDLLSNDLKTVLYLQKESVYFEELPTIKHKYDSKGRIVIESKADYKKRTGRSSPDYSDSLALANYGRHVGVQHGNFGGKPGATPLARQTKRKPRSGRVKAREY